MLGIEEQPPVQHIKFSDCIGKTHDEDSIHALYEWLIVESISHVDIPANYQDDALKYFCEAEGIEINQIQKHPLEFGLTVNGHVITCGNQILHQIFNFYQGMYEEVEKLRVMDKEKEEAGVTNLLNCAEELCTLAESIQTIIKDVDSKKDHESRIQMNRERVATLKSKYK